MIRHITICGKERKLFHNTEHETKLATTGIKCRKITLRTEYVKSSILITGLKRRKIKTVDNFIIRSFVICTFFRYN
jgi:hypothetical protein